MNPRLLFIATWVVATGLLVGCGGDNKPSAALSSTFASGATTSTTTSSAGDDQAAAKAAYLGYWRVFDSVTNPPNPTDPSIVQVSVDPARADLVDGVTTLHATGQSIREPTTNASSHRVDVVVAGSRADFTDCFVDARVTVDASGNTVNDKVVTKLLKGYLVLDGGTWKVAQYNEVQRTDGATQCGA